MVIADSELQEFIRFLRSRYRVEQVLQFSPPNVEGEVFRAKSGERLIFGCKTESGEICVSSDPQFEVQLLQQWRNRLPQRP